MTQSPPSTPEENALIAGIETLGTRVTALTTGVDQLRRYRTKATWAIIGVAVLGVVNIALVATVIVFGVRVSEVAHCQATTQAESSRLNRVARNAADNRQITQLDQQEAFLAVELDPHSTPAQRTAARDAYRGSARALRAAVADAIHTRDNNPPAPGGCG
jgi:hypothetical protein